MRILVVDDDDDVRELLGFILRSEGHEVEEAFDGVDALERVRTCGYPDLILLDMMMPRLDGEAFLREIRTDPRSGDTAIILISGHAAANEKAAELGVVGCLVKPVELQHLLAMLHTVARTKNATSRPSAARA